MEITDSTVLVLGAGFTRAFAQNAPLLRIPPGKLQLASIKEKFSPFEDVVNFLEPLLKEKEINAEEILSRLFSGTPYESEFLAKNERTLLYDSMAQKFTRLIHNIEIDPPYVDLFNQFASTVLQKSASCITFNYDTKLDKALYNYDQRTWHPDGGYGFFCIPSLNLVENRSIFMDDCDSLLLKLHGSLNWHAKKGYKQPYSIDAVVHYENWFEGITAAKRRQIELHIERASLIIPPVFNKAELNSQPILQLVWSEAFRKLRKAERVVFIGYSMPTTDVAAKFLFKDSLAIKNKNLYVISNKGNEDEKINTYRQLFPDIPSANFYFNGAIKWIQENVHVVNERLEPAG